MQLYLTRGGKALFAMVVGLVTETKYFLFRKGSFVKMQKKQ